MAIRWKRVFFSTGFLFISEKIIKTIRTGGANVVYAPAGGDPLLVMNINNTNATLNHYNGDTGEIIGEVVTVEVPPVIVDGRTMVPLRFIAETIGLEVEWDNNTKTVYLYSALANRNLEELPDDFIYIYSEEYQIVGDPSDGKNYLHSTSHML